MKIYRTIKGIIIEHDESYHLFNRDWDSFINRQNLFQMILDELENARIIYNLDDSTILKPVQNQEIWAAGVTYLKSKVARMEESKDAGGGDFYDRVYDAARPEIFFKNTPARTAGPGQKVHIRDDSHWNVPEPELTLFVCSTGSIEGYTIGNDMSSRDIEGENPLYLPQAKVWDMSSAIGPCILVKEHPLPSDSVISMEILRQGQTVYQDSVQISQMKRTADELVSYLCHACTFKYGVFLMTGTCLVPPDGFSLISDDEIRISITSIGTLVNIVK